MMKIVEIVKVGQSAREIEVSDMNAVRLTGNISAPGKTVYLSRTMFDAVKRLETSALVGLSEALH